MIRNKTALRMIVLAASLAAAGTLPAAEVEVTITNITPGQVISPPMVVAHSVPFALGGQAATPGIELLAESGDASLLVTELSAFPQVGATASAEGPLPPGASVTLSLDTDGGFDYISAFGMLVTTNDTFFALISQKAPVGLAVYYPAAWDAGTEVNNESCEDIPGPPCGGSGPGGTDENGVMHIGNGIHGTGDLNAATLGWNNPVVQVVIRRN